MVIALFGACLVLAPQLGGPWTIYTLVTAGVSLASSIWPMSPGAATQRTGLAQRVFIATYWLWITILSLQLVAH